MTLELRHALDDAYAVFAGYNLPDYLGLGGNFQLRDLSAARWHQLNEDHDMGVLMFSDDGSLFRYFLPRWLEWLIEETTSRDDLKYWELDNVGYRLAQAKWRNWPVEEVAVLRELFATWARAELAQYSGAPPSSWSRRENNLGEQGEQLGLNGVSAYSELLRFLAEIGDVATYLEPWLDCNLPQLARWLWTENLREFPTAQNWVASSRLESELENAFFADADGPNAELFSRSIELVRSLRAL